MINIDDFKKLELKIGTVLEVEEIEGSEKLIKLKIDLAEETPRQVLSGIKSWYKSEDLVGKQLVVISNLEPKMMMGFESQGMILAASDDENGAVVLTPIKPISNGSLVR